LQENRCPFPTVNTATAYADGLFDSESKFVQKAKPPRSRGKPRMLRTSKSTASAVGVTGSRQVTPTDSTTYRLVAKGTGGSQEATAQVTVAAPAHRLRSKRQLTTENSNSIKA